jgi:tetratricopeptide (TPR) repeat protein
MKGELDLAIADYNESLRRDPHDADAYAQRGEVWMFKYECDKALADFDQSLRIDPMSAKVHQRRGLVLLSREEYEQARVALDEAIRIDPQAGENYGARGSLRLVKRQYHEAISDFDQAIRLAPDDPCAYANRGDAFYRSKRYDQAIADYMEAARREPLRAEADERFAWMLATCPDARYRDGKKAVERAREACTKTHWKTSFGLNVLAAAYAETGDFERAVYWQREAIAVATNPTVKAKSESRLGIYVMKKPCRDEEP